MHGTKGFIIIIEATTAGSRKSKFCHVIEVTDHRGVLAGVDSSIKGPDIRYKSNRMKRMLLPCECPRQRITAIGCYLLQHQVALL